MPSIDHDPEQRAYTIRALLAQPLLLRSRDEELFRTVAVGRSWLTRWFEDNLGWALHVDVRAGIARLHKRARQPDARRGLLRLRSGARPFDPLRYQLLALICAELLRRPHTTLGDLADAVERLCGAEDRLLPMDVTRHGDRLAFVDALLWLLEQGAVDVTAGEVEGFGASQAVDAVLRAETTLIPLLLSSDMPPSRIDADDADTWTHLLSAEPRYGTAPIDPDATDREQRVRWARHQAIRALLDDPAVDFAELPGAVRDYLSTPAGREKAIAAANTAGLEVERHADVWLAIDSSRESTASTFASGGRASTTQQAAALLLAALADTGSDGARRPIARPAAALERTLRGHLDRHPSWAKTARRGRGTAVLYSDAIELLEEFGLAKRNGDEVVPRPAAARFVVSIEAGSTTDPGLAPSADAASEEEQRP